jgi:hypothetical protein
MHTDGAPIVFVGKMASLHNHVFNTAVRFQHVFGATSFSVTDLEGFPVVAMIQKKTFQDKTGVGTYPENTVNDPGYLINLLGIFVNATSQYNKDNGRRFFFAKGTQRSVDERAVKVSDARNKVIEVELEKVGEDAVKMESKEDSFPGVPMDRRHHISNVPRTVCGGRSRVQKFADTEKVVVAHPDFLEDTFLQ